MAGRRWVRLRARRVRAHSPARPELRHPGFARHVQLPARDDRRRGAHLARLRQPDADRSRAPASPVSRPGTMWTSGQWMTERIGGSDVGQTETVARRDGDTWRLYGTKWFTSATTADMALTLRKARRQSTGRPRLGDVLPRAPRRERPASEPPHQPAQRQVRNAQASDRGAHAGRRDGGSRGRARERRSQHHADAEHHPDLERGRRDPRHAARRCAHPRLRRASARRLAQR